MILKKIAPFLLFIPLSVSVFAQDSKDDPGVRFGLKGGLSIASIIKTNDPNFHSDLLFGFNGGAVLQIPFGHVIAIQPEVLFSQKGYRATGDYLGSSYDYRRYLNFLDIPLLLRINATSNFGIVVGPQFSWLLSQHTNFKSGLNSYEQTVNNDNEDIRKNILGGVVGVDVNLDRNIFIYARYTLDFQNDNGNGSPSTPAYKNQVFQVGLGVLF